MTTNADEALAEYKRTVAGKPYRPANRSEGEFFRFNFCDRCSKDINEDCPIYTQTLISDTDDEDYPKEWIHDADGDPNCTAFEPSYSFFKIRFFADRGILEFELDEIGPYGRNKARLHLEIGDLKRFPHRYPTHPRLCENIALELRSKTRQKTTDADR